MKKIELLNALTENNATETETGIYTMSKNDFENFVWENGENINIDEISKNHHEIKIGKSVLTINIKNRNKTAKTEKSPTGGHGVKSKNSGYIIIMKNFDDKKPQTITNIDNCADIKLWIKTLNRKNIEYLRIYDTLKNACRKSAWIERDVVNG